MEKYSESVKDAQEKLEQAEKKATDVSVIREGSKEGPRRGWEGRKGPGVPSPRTDRFPLCNTTEGRFTQVAQDTR